MSDPKNERQAEMGVDETLTSKAARTDLEFANRDSEAAEQENDSTSSPEAKISQLNAELEKYKDIALRSSADLDNYRKRVMREKEEAVRYANATFLEKLIPILDNFELGLQAAKSAGGNTAILDGMSIVAKQLQEFLESIGVETIDATGQPFNANLHEAIAQEHSSEVSEGSVIRQVRKGYRLKDRLIRPANVVVSQGVFAGDKKAEARAGA